MTNKLFFAVGALVFAGSSAFGIRVGRFKTQVFKTDPYLWRRDDPILFWTYAVALLVGAVFLAFIAIFKV